MDNLAAATSLSQDKKKGRAFVTFLPNENRELSFDVTEFMRHKKAEVTDRLHISNVLLLLLLKLLLLKNPKPIRSQIKVIGKAYMICFLHGSSHFPSSVYEIENYRGKVLANRRLSELCFLECSVVFGHIWLYRKETKSLEVNAIDYSGYSVSTTNRYFISL